MTIYVRHRQWCIVTLFKKHEYHRPDNKPHEALYRRPSSIFFFFFPIDLCNICTPSNGGTLVHELKLTVMSSHKQDLHMRSQDTIDAQ